MLSLSEGIIGAEYAVLWFIAASSTMECAKRELGLTENSRVRVVGNFGGSVIISHHGRRFAVSGDLAKRIKVRELGKEKTE